MAELYKRKSNTHCVICNSPIYRRPAEIEKNTGRVFCSMKCFGISCRREKPCIVCGKAILSGLHKKTCSRTCSNIHRAGIKYKIGCPQDKVKTQSALKSRLIKARGEKCERCGYGKTEILQIHHKDRDRGNGDLKNLELVCPNCHYEEHYLEKDELKVKM